MQTLHQTKQTNLLIDARLNQISAITETGLRVALWEIFKSGRLIF